MYRFIEVLSTPALNGLLIIKELTLQTSIAMTNKIIYWVSTGLLSLLMLFSASMYFINHEMVAEAFTSLGYPTFIIYPLAVAKILAVVAILSRKSALLKEWAYAGLFFDFSLALASHLMVQDGEYGAALVALLFLIISRVYDPKVFAQTESLVSG